MSIWDDFFDTVQLAAEDVYPAAPEVAAPPAGTLTMAQFERWLGELWDHGRAPSASQIDEYAEKATMVLEQVPLSCGALLFPLELPRDMVTLVVHEAWAIGVQVHPMMVPYGAPVQGPQPAVCTREPHEGSPWHWDGRGTWWR